MSVQLILGLFVSLVCVATANDGNVDVILQHMKQVIDNVPSIPKERADVYKRSIDNARPCIENVARDAPAERINIHVEKLLPISLECWRLIHDEQDVEKRKQNFEECVRGKVKDQSTGLDEVQRRNLMKVKECVKEAINH